MAAVFCLGGAAYVGMELLWRGRSHGSMFFAGGLCLLLVGHLQEVEPKLPLPLQIAAGAAVITMVELAVGLMVNRDYSIWDYRAHPGNWLGQICPAFTALWIPLSWLALAVYDRLKNWMEQ